MSDVALYTAFAAIEEERSRLAWLAIAAAPHVHEDAAAIGDVLHDYDARRTMAACVRETERLDALHAALVAAASLRFATPPLRGAGPQLVVEERAS